MMGRIGQRIQINVQNSRRKVCSLLKAYLGLYSIMDYHTREAEIFLAPEFTQHGSAYAALHMYFLCFLNGGGGFQYIDWISLQGPLSYLRYSGLHHSNLYSLLK